MAISCNNVATLSIGTTADTIAFALPSKQVRVRNTHATQGISVRVFSATTAAAALAAATATVAVAGANENFLVPAGKDVVVYRSNRQLYVALSHIGSGATTTGTVESTLFKDAD